MRLLRGHVPSYCSKMEATSQKPATWKSLITVTPSSDRPQECKEGSRGCILTLRYYLASKSTHTLTMEEKLEKRPSSLPRTKQTAQSNITTRSASKKQDEWILPSNQATGVKLPNIVIKTCRDRLSHQLTKGPTRNEEVDPNCGTGRVDNLSLVTSCPTTISHTHCFSMAHKRPHFVIAETSFIKCLQKIFLPILKGQNQSHTQRIVWIHQ